jgi:hypothetical protein
MASEDALRELLDLAGGKTFALRVALDRLRAIEATADLADAHLEARVALVEIDRILELSRSCAT